jgi:hypothetical protein
LDSETALLLREMALGDDAAEQSEEAEANTQYAVVGNPSVRDPIETTSLAAS